MKQEMSERGGGMEIEGIVRRAGVRMVFQPIVCLGSGNVVAHEALVRGGGVGAAELVNAAAKRGMMPALDRVAHCRALACAEYLSSETLLFLNASPEAVVEDGFERRMSRLMEAAEVGAGRVVIEITEAGMRADDPRLARGVAKVRSLGFGIAVDDVGAGQSDLSRILRLRPDWIKLDRTLVQGLGGDPFGRSLVGALTRFAAQNGVHVVAEGIELPSQARQAADLGVGYGQGYWFAYPMSLPEVAARRGPDRVMRRWRSALQAA